MEEALDLSSDRLLNDDSKMIKTLELVGKDPRTVSEAHIFVYLGREIS